MNTVAICWYATVGHDPEDVQVARALTPWCRGKAQQSVLDSRTKLCRVIVAAQFRREGPAPLTSQEIAIVRLSWEGGAVSVTRSRDSRYARKIVCAPVVSARQSEVVTRVTTEVMGGDRTRAR